MTDMLRRILSELHRNPDADVSELSQILYPDNPAMHSKVAKALVQLETLGFIDGEGKPTSKTAASD